MKEIVRCTDCGTPYIPKDHNGDPTPCPACLSLYMKFITEVARKQGNETKYDFVKKVTEARKKL